jgi:drug/metabolite transporter (DMT)-like permease
MAVLRAGERPPPAFWLASAVGVGAVLVFAAAQGAGRPQAADGLLLAAVALGALGYAEGGRLAREMGGWRVICWALILAAPVLTPPVLVVVARDGLAAWQEAGPSAWLGFAYVSLVSMFLGFFAWYRGLALGGVARVGQIQLLQPVLTLGWAALLLREGVDRRTLLASGLVIGSVALTRLSWNQAGGQRRRARDRRPAGSV